MPNWCQNVIKIQGETKKLKKLIKKCGLDKDQLEFDFNTLIEVPQELERTVTPLKVVETDQEAEQINSKCRKSYVNGQTSIFAITKKEEARRFELYGAVDWYRFRVENWGTKWKPCNVKIHEQVLDKDIGYIIVSFDTPWTPAEPIAKYLEKEGFIITGAYLEEGCDIKGYYLNNPGEFYFGEHMGEHWCSYSIEWRG